MKILGRYFKEKRNKDLYTKVENEFEERGPIAHNWDHIYRDIINAIWIGEAENANMDIVFPAIVLHDIGFIYNPDPSIHHQIGSEKCIEWLDDWDEKERKLIQSCILCHKGKNMEFKIEPTTLEEKVVYDADQLEKMGYAGLFGSVRVGVEFAESTLPELKSLYEITKLFKDMSPIQLYTKKAKEIAKKKGGLKFDLFKRAYEELKEYYN
ncbi:MAG: HD domain-containing protein [Candidatus Dojkabacteria bacterium]|nr:HD domain-containing protein [Candidatus Dojkabacteria bacterium]